MMVDEGRALDRHALVMSVWLSLTLVAAALFKFGFSDGGWPFITASFGTVIVGFIGHVLVNVVTGTGFTPKEVSLGLVLYMGALITFLLTVLVSAEVRLAQFLGLSLGFLAVFVVVVFTMATHLGVRGAFESFDVIRRFRGGRVR